MSPEANRRIRALFLARYARDLPTSPPSPTSPTSPTMIARWSRSARAIGTTVVAPVGACLAFWCAFAASLGACVDQAGGDDAAPPASRIFAHWDPLACGDAPHRVAIELYDDAGAQVAGSAPCVRGGVTLDVFAWGRYRGRAYAAVPGEPPRSEVPLLVDVDMPAIQWDLETPE